MLGEPDGAKFREQALAYLRAFKRRAGFTETGTFFATFNLATGQPLFPRITQGWEYTPQYRNGESTSGVIGLRAPISLAFAHKMSGKADLRDMFDRTLPLFRLSGFEHVSKPPKNIPAGLLAQGIGALLNMFEATDDNQYRDGAVILSRYALAHYHRSGFFVCGPPAVPRYADKRVDVWSTYCNRGGSAELSLTLLRLYLVLSGQKDFVVENPFSYF